MLISGENAVRIKCTCEIVGVILFAHHQCMPCKTQKQPWFDLSGQSKKGIGFSR